MTNHDDRKQAQTVVDRIKYFYALFAVVIYLLRFSVMYDMILKEQYTLF